MIFSDVHAEDVSLRFRKQQAARNVFLYTFPFHALEAAKTWYHIYYIVVVYDSYISRDAEMLVFQPSFEFSSQNGVMYVHYD